MEILFAEFKPKSGSANCHALRYNCSGWSGAETSWSATGWRGRPILGCGPADNRGRAKHVSPGAGRCRQCARSVVFDLTGFVERGVSWLPGGRGFAFYFDHRRQGHQERTGSRGAFDLGNARKVGRISFLVSWRMLEPLQLEEREMSFDWKRIVPVKAAVVFEPVCISQLRISLMERRKKIMSARSAQGNKLTLADKFSRFGRTVRDAEWRRYAKLVFAGKFAGIALVY